MKSTLTVLLLILLPNVGQAAIVGVALGSFPRTDPIPLGPYQLKLLPADTSSVYSTVTSVPGSPPLGGPVGFSIGMSHRKIGQGWATWSPGSPASWDKSVYYTNGALSVTLTMPPSVPAFVFYAEPNPFSPHVITATADDGTVVTQSPDGYAGAMGYGFYGTGGSTIKSITVSSPTADFAIGEFYSAPEPTSLSLLGMAVGLLVCRRR